MSAPGKTAPSDKLNIAGIAFCVDRVALALTDSKDVFFQRNCFDGLKQGEVHIFEQEVNVTFDFGLVLQISNVVGRMLPAISGDPSDSSPGAAGAAPAGGIYRPPPLPGPSELEDGEGVMEKHIDSEDGWNYWSCRQKLSFVCKKEVCIKEEREEKEKS